MMHGPRDDPAEPSAETRLRDAARGDERARREQLPVLPDLDAALTAEAQQLSD